MGSVIQESIWRCTSVHGNAKLVLLALANGADDGTGECAISYPQIAHLTGLSLRSCKGIVKQLAENRLVAIIKGHREDNGYARNTYVLAESLRQG